MTGADTVTLGFPRDARYLSVARLVVGGIAAPLDMPYDALDDLQLAISSLLDNDALAAEGEAMTLRLDVGDGWLRATLSSFDGSGMDTLLADRDSDDFDLRRLLETVVDEIEVDSASGSVTLTKRVKATA
jgi:anti-sigma regulatory factor (Ser/Thr protein kinase)